LFGVYAGERDKKERKGKKKKGNPLIYIRPERSIRAQKKQVGRVGGEKKDFFSSHAPEKGGGGEKERGKIFVYN